MKPSERVRKGLAVTGCVFWMGSSLLPLFGGNAKHAVLCRGREFTGAFDDCFNDYLPLAELGAPIVALLLLYPFSRFAFFTFAPSAQQRTSRWRLASRRSASFWHPVLMIVSLLGCAWALWRMVLYPLDPVTLPFIGFWALFATWFAMAAWCARPSKQG